MTDTPWLPMEIAPFDRRVDLRAQRWVAGHERIRVEIFTGCKWCEGGSVRHPAPYWRRLPTGWAPIGWREADADTAAAG
ncbi:hypothetical protein [Methylobacterium fujisawaense]